MLVWWGLTPIPTCSGRNFCVAVAELQKDPNDKFGDAIVDAVENLQGEITGPEGTGKGAPYTGIEVTRIPRTPSTAGNKTRAAEASAVSKARRYLEKYQIQFRS